MMWKIPLVIEISCQNEILFDPRWWSKTICVDHFLFKTERESSRFVYSSGLTHLRENYFSLFFFYDATSFFIWFRPTFVVKEQKKTNKYIHQHSFSEKRNSRMQQVREEESGWFKLTLKSQENQDADDRKNEFLPSQNW